MKMWKKLSKGTFLGIILVLIMAVPVGAAAGKKVSGWVYKNEKIYYIHPVRGKLSGWHKIGNRYYCFTKEGYVKTSQWLKKGDSLCYVDYEGKVIRTEKYVNNTSRGYGEIFLVGDSRFARAHGMQIQDRNMTYIAKPGQGYQWLTQSAWPEIVHKVEAAAKKYPSKKNAVVMNLGVNDLTNYKKYIIFVKNQLLPLAKKNHCDVYYVSVNPVSEEKMSPHGENIVKKNPKQINRFNRALVDALPLEVRYIDTNTYLLRNFTSRELTIRDGVHYDSRISKAIFDQIVMGLKP